MNLFLMCLAHLQELNITYTVDRCRSLFNFVPRNLTAMQAMKKNFPKVRVVLGIFLNFLPWCLTFPKMEHSVLIWSIPSKADFRFLIFDPFIFMLLKTVLQIRSISKRWIHESTNGFRNGIRQRNLSTWLRRNTAPVLTNTENGIIIYNFPRESFPLSNLEPFSFKDYLLFIK